MATRTTQVLSLGHFSIRLDSNERKDGAESADKLLQHSFGSSDEPLWKTCMAMTLVDGDNDGSVSFGGLTYLAGYTKDYIRYQSGSGSVSKTIDTGLLCRAEITYWDGSKATTNVRIIQDGSGNLFLLPPPSTATSAEINALTTKPISSLKILHMESNGFTDLALNRFGLPSDPTFICFAAGTEIALASGSVKAGDFSIGDLVRTADGAAHPVRWVGKRHFDAATLRLLPRLRPIRVRAGALGANLPERDLLVSPQHRICIRADLVRRLPAASGVLVAAKHLLELEGVEIAEDCAEITYVHILLDRHAVVFANGAEAETLYPGAQAAAMRGSEAWEEIVQLFPELALAHHSPAPARPIVKGTEAKKLVFRIVKNGLIRKAA